MGVGCCGDGLAEGVGVDCGVAVDVGVVGAEYCGCEESGWEWCAVGYAVDDVDGGAGCCYGECLAWGEGVEEVEDGVDEGGCCVAQAGCGG